MGYGGGCIDSMDDVKIPGVADLSLDEPELESVEGQNIDDDHSV